MASFAKLLAAMRRNPRGDFSINDIGTICRALEQRGLRLRAPRGGGSHYTVQYPGGILTIPARRPLKPVYVKAFTQVVDSVLGNEDADEKHG